MKEKGTLMKGKFGGGWQWSEIEGSDLSILNFGVCSSFSAKKKSWAVNTNKIPMPFLFSLQITVTSGAAWGRREITI